jgi:hypothetical protein
MNLFMLVRILFQYLERTDRTVLDLAKEVLKDCERKHNTKDSKYETLADAISERVRDAVGESHWKKARMIQKQLALNQQKKKMRTMKGVMRQRDSKNSPMTAHAQHDDSQVRPSLNDEAVQGVQTMSAMSQATPTATSGDSFLSRNATECVNDATMQDSPAISARGPQRGGGNLPQSPKETEEQGSYNLPPKKRVVFAPIP